MSVLFNIITLNLSVLTLLENHLEGIIYDNNLHLFIYSSMYLVYNVLGQVCVADTFSL